MQHGPSRVVCWPVAFVICPMRLSCVPAARGIWGEESCGCGYSRITVVSRDCQENRADDCLENTGGCDAATGRDRGARPVHGLAVLGRTEPVPLVHGARLPRSAVLVAGSAADPVLAGPGVLAGRPVSRRLALREPDGPAPNPQVAPIRPAGARQSVVEGQVVSVRVDIGLRRTIKTNK